MCILLAEGLLIPYSFEEPKNSIFKSEFHKNKCPSTVKSFLKPNFPNYSIKSLWSSPLKG